MKLTNIFKRSIRENDGFSIVEILVVLVVVGVAIVPLTGVQVGSRQTVSEANRYSTAVGIAQSTLEQLRARDFGTVQADSLNNGVYSIQTSTTQYIDPMTGTPMPNVEELRVSVSWRGGGPGQNIDLSYVQARR